MLILLRLIGVKLPMKLISIYFCFLISILIILVLIKLTLKFLFASAVKIILNEVSLGVRFVLSKVSYPITIRLYTL